MPKYLYSFSISALGFAIDTRGLMMLIIDLAGLPFKLTFTHYFEVFSALSSECRLAPSDIIPVTIFECMHMIKVIFLCKYPRLCYPEIWLDL